MQVHLGIYASHTAAIIARGFQMKLAESQIPRRPLRLLPIGSAGFARVWLLAGLALFCASLLRYWPSFGALTATPVGPETWNLAHNLREHAEFANPFVPHPTGPSTHLAPAYPAMLALLTWLFGAHTAGAFASHVAAALAASALLGLLPYFSAKLGFGNGPGLAGAIVWIVGELSLFPNWEASYAGLLIAASTVLFRRLLAPGRTSKATVLAAAFIIALLLLLNPSCLPVFLFWIGWLAWKWKRALFCFPGVLLVLLPAILISPWMVRNYLLFDRFVPIRGNFGLELAISNNDCASFGLVANHETGCFQKVHPNGSEIEAARVLIEGEAAYNSRRLDEACAWIGHNPRKFAGFALQRAEAFWFPHDEPGFLAGAMEPGRRSERLAIYLMTLLSLAGLWLAWRRDRLSAVILSIWLILYPAVYYMVQYEDRYRHPIMWMTFLLGGLPMAEGLKRLLRIFTRRVDDSGADFQ